MVIILILKQENMNNKIFKWLQVAFVGTVAFCGFTACADDHFDIKPEVEGRKTLWENISSNEDLSEFADLLQRINYSKSEGVSTVETYADLFGGNQTFTVWAPKNGSFDYAKYDALLKTGDAADAYIVEKEFVRNCMTRFSHLVMGEDSTRLLLFNGKNVMFRSKTATIKDQQIVQSNIGATNGVLHVIDGAIPYQPNIYEFLSSREDIDSVSSFITGFQEIVFDELQSTQGPTVNGQVTWVDSIFQTSNLYFSYLGTDLTREDSSYAMIIPTNDAWTGALEKVKPYFVYKTNYKQDVATVTPEGKDTLIEGVETKFTEEELDSIVNFRVKNAISQNLVFNINAQHGYDYTQFGVEGACDSLVTASGTTFYNPYSARLFNGAEPIEVSNGYAYIVDKFNYRPSDSWAEDLEIEAESGANIETADRNTIPGRETVSYKVTYDFNEAVKDTTIKYGAYVMTPSSSSVHPGATFILRDLLSCKYDIYVLVAYNNSDNKPNKFQATLAYDEPTKRNNNKRLKNENEDDPDNFNTNYFSNKSPYVDENGEYRLVDSVLVAKDFEFPVCYKGLTDAYATLTIKGYFKSTEKNKYSREIHIDKIVLKAKE